MELFVFIVGAVAVIVVLMWRGRRGGSTGPDTLTQGLPDDQRDKNGGMISLPNRGRPWGRGN